MYKRPNGKFMADWFDADGIRRRKQFSTAKAAHQFQHEQNALALATRAGRELRLSVHHVYRKKGPLQQRVKTATAQLQDAATAQNE